MGLILVLPTSPRCTSDLASVAQAKAESDSAAALSSGFLAVTKAPGCFGLAVNNNQGNCRQLVRCKLEHSSLCLILALRHCSCFQDLPGAGTSPPRCTFPMQSLCCGWGSFELTREPCWEHLDALCFEIRSLLFSKIRLDLSLWINIFSSEGLHHCQERGTSPTSGNKNLYSTCSA